MSKCQMEHLVRCTASRFCTMVPYWGTEDNRLPYRCRLHKFNDDMFFDYGQSKTDPDFQSIDMRNRCEISNQLERLIQSGKIFDSNMHSVAFSDWNITLTRSEGLVDMKTLPTLGIYWLWLKNCIRKAPFEDCRNIIKYRLKHSPKTVLPSGDLFIDQKSIFRYQTMFLVGLLAIGTSGCVGMGLTHVKQPKHALLSGIIAWLALLGISTRITRNNCI